MLIFRNTTKRKFVALFLAVFMLLPLLALSLQGVDGDTEYTVDFDLEPVGTTIVVRNSAGSIVAPSLTSVRRYHLSTGEYTYTATSPLTNVQPITNKRFAVTGDMTINVHVTGGGGGFSQTSSASIANVTNGMQRLREAANGTREGLEYWLNRVEGVVDISDGKDLVFTVGVSRGTPLGVNRIPQNIVRYTSVIDAETGEVVSNFYDDRLLPNHRFFESPVAPFGGQVDADGRNSSGAYQLGYELVGSASVRMTVPNAALFYGRSYYIVLGSAISGDNAGNMLFAPIIYQITTSDVNGGGEVEDDPPHQLQPNRIIPTVIRGSNDQVSNVQFNRTTASLGYAPGGQIHASIAGQEIILLGNNMFGLTTSWQIRETVSGKPVPRNYFMPGGANSSPYGDIRFTMPNAAISVDVVFGYKVAFAFEDGTPVPIDDITVMGGQREFIGEPEITIESFSEDGHGFGRLAYGDFFFVLPAGDYSYTVTAAGHEPVNVDFTVTGNATVTVEKGPIAFRRGDVNGDGMIDVRDVRRVLDHIYEISPLEGNALLAADVNGDGVVDVRDVRRILDHIYEIAFIE